MQALCTHPLASAVVRNDDLPTVIDQLGKAIRATRRHLSNLLKGDHRFWIPERQPLWDSCWNMHPADTVHFIRSRRWNLADLERLQPTLLHYQNVARLTIVRASDECADIEISFSLRANGILRVYQNPKSTSVRELDSFWKMIAPLLGITDLYEPNERGPLFIPRDKSDSLPEVTFEAETYQNLLRLKHFPSEADGLAVFNKVAKFLDESLRPHKFAITMQPDAADVPALVEECRRQNSEWSIEFFGKYRRKFDPYATPKNPDGSGFYPVLQCTPDGEFMEVQVSVEHAKGKSWLVLHSEAGEDMLRKVIEEAGLEATYNS